MNLFFVVFCLIGLLPNSMSKLIHNRCRLTFRVLHKIIPLLTFMQPNSWVPFYVFVRYSVLFSSEIILKQLFASGLVNSVE